METVLFPRYWHFMRGIHRWPVNSPPAQRPVTRNFDAFFDLRLNKRLSKRDAGDLGRHRAHYDVTVMRKWMDDCWLYPLVLGDVIIDPCYKL